MYGTCKFCGEEKSLSPNIVNCPIHKMYADIGQGVNILDEPASIQTTVYSIPRWDATMRQSKNAKHLCKGNERLHVTSRAYGQDADVEPRNLRCITVVRNQAVEIG
jgi:hypothetical protein